MSNPFRNRRRNAAFAAVLLAGTALGGVATGWAPAFAEGAVQAPQGGQIQPAAAVVAPAMQGLPGFADLVAKGAVRKGQPVKVLGDGEISVAFTIKGVKASASAKAKIEAAGGSISED